MLISHFVSVFFLYVACNYFMRFNSFTCHCVVRAYLHLHATCQSFYHISLPPLYCLGRSSFQKTLSKVRQKYMKTKQHSSRMRRMRLPTVCVLVATTRCQYQVNKFEQVSSDDHQMPVAGGESPGLMFGIPYHVSYPMMHVIISPPPHEQTYACENIAFLHLRLRSVITWWHVCVCVRAKNSIYKIHFSVQWLESKGGAMEVTKMSKRTLEHHS